MEEMEFTGLYSSRQEERSSTLVPRMLGFSRHLTSGIDSVRMR